MPWRRVAPPAPSTGAPPSLLPGLHPSYPKQLPTNINLLGYINFPFKIQHEFDIMNYFFHCTVYMIFFFSFTQSTLTITNINKSYDLPLVKEVDIIEHWQIQGRY